MTNPKLQVTPALVVTHLLTTVIFKPLAFVGLVISEFVENATSEYCNLLIIVNNVEV